MPNPSRLSSRYLSRFVAQAVFFALTVFGLEHHGLSQEFATQVISYNPGPNASLMDPTLALGGPQGGGCCTGSLDVVSLGVGGDLTLGFNVVITDGGGADFIVFENGFFVNGTEVFSEVAFVEVSTNGIHFARFPTQFALQGVQPPFGGVKIGAFRGIAGNLPVFANVLSNNLDPSNPLEAGGEAFDLFDLRFDPLVQSGTVDLSQIHFVRLIDIEEGVETDSIGNIIYDNGGSTGSADFDSVSIINHTGNQDPSSPIIEMDVDAQGHLTLRLEDANGLGDLDFASIRVSLSTIEIPLSLLLRNLRIIGISQNHIELVTHHSLLGTAFVETLAVSLRDRSGQRSTDFVWLQG